MAFLFFLTVALYGQIFKINEIQGAVVVEYQPFLPKVKTIVSIVYS